MRKTKQARGTMSSTMKSRAVPNLTAAPGDYNHNGCPAFSKPRDVGGSALPERFTEGMHGASVPGRMQSGTSITFAGKKR